MQAVFLDSQTFSENIDLSPLKHAVTKLSCYTLTDEQDIVNRCKTADIIITNKVQLSASSLAQLPKLALICITATGYNNVDIVAARQLNIAVTNVSGYAKHSVAQYIFAQLLNYYSRVNQHNSNTRAGLWQTSDTFCLHSVGSEQLANKTLGLIGYGAIAKQVAQIAQAFNMNVIIGERKGSDQIRGGRVAFEQLIQQADIISLHCPLTKQNNQLIDQSLLKQMRSNAVLVNTARGGLINSQHLADALRDKQIAYAIVDVLEQEPPPANHPLLQLSATQIAVTAHIAWASKEAQQQLITLVAENIQAYQRGQHLNRID